MGNRFEYYDDDSEEWALNQGRWANNVKQTFEGKRGQLMLRDLRDALNGLPTKELGAGALCQVTPEGHVLYCIMGAFAHHKGDDNGKLRVDDPGALGASDTAYVGEGHGMSFTMAWTLAQMNDDEYKRATPGERWRALMDFTTEKIK